MGEALTSARLLCIRVQPGADAGGAVWSFAAWCLPLVPGPAGLHHGQGPAAIAWLPAAPTAGVNCSRENPTQNYRKLQQYLLQGTALSQARPCTVLQGQQPSSVPCWSPAPRSLWARSCRARLKEQRCHTGVNRQQPHAAFPCQEYCSEPGMMHGLTLKSICYTELC